ncbi:MAG: hypothetical protein J5552_11610 [Prevotella sp.]|nr:hypothetical protein [Prevotella sp.]
MLRNTDFNHPWELVMWSNTTDWTNYSGGTKENTCAEMYGRGFDISQTISVSVANGKYVLHNQAFYNNADAANPSYLYANEDKEPIAIFNANNEGTPDNMAGASVAFLAGQYANSVSTVVVDNKLKVGIKNATTAGNAWTIMDNFYLEYIGSCLVNDAIPLPEDGIMDAGTWYYFDIQAAANNYKANASNLSDIICTADGTQITTEATGNITLTEEDNVLEAKRYYVKSLTNNSLAITFDTFSYNVGDATVSITNNDFIKSLTTITYTFANESTTDPDASFAILNSSATVTLSKGGSQITTGALSLSGNVLTATFSDVTLDLNSEYTVTLPADVVGFAGQNVSNAAVSVNFKTGIIADGVYYFKRNGTENYLTRGGSWGTEAVTDKFGISFDAAIQTDGAYTLKNIDQSLVDNVSKYLNLGTYTDQGTAYHWTIAPASDGFYLKTTDGKYMTTAQEETFGYNYLTATTTESDAIVWTLLGKSDYASKLADRKDSELAAIATAAGKTATTAAAFETLLTTDYGMTDATDKITNASLASNADGWTAVSYNANRRNQAEGADVIGFNGGAEVWNYIGGAEQTVSGLPEGIYKITVKSVWRLAEANAATRAGSEANVTAWIYANDSYTQLKSWNDYQLADNAALHASTDDTYVNTVYAYVAAGQNLTIGIASPSWCGVPWMPFYDWTLTRYESKATEGEITALNNAITAAEEYTLGFETDEYAPYNNVDACVALANAKAIDTQTAAGSVVVEATTALNEALNDSWTVNVTDLDAIYDGDLANATIQATSENVVLTGWTTVSGNTRQTFKGNGEDGKACLGDGEVGLFVHPGTYTYGEIPGYTMPLEASTMYVAEAKYCSWASDQNNDFTLTILKNGTTVATKSFGKNGTACTEANALKSVKLYFETGEDVADYVLSVVVNGNSFMTGFHINKAVVMTISEDATEAPTASDCAYVTLTRTLPADKWSTFSVPFSLTAEQIAASDLNGASIREFTNDVEDNTLIFENATAIEAGKPYLVKPTAEVVNPVFEGVAVVATDGVTVGDGSYQFAAQIYNKTLPTDVTIAYLSTDGSVKKLNTGGAIKGLRAYFIIPDGADGIRIAIDDETGIAELAADKVAAEGIYDLNGRRVESMQKGVYVVNGKKVIK